MTNFKKAFYGLNKTESNELNTIINKVEALINVISNPISTSTIISGAYIAAGVTNDPVPVKMDNSLNEILIYVINTGDSTNLTVNIYSSPDGVIQAPLSTLTLSTTVAVSDVPVSIVPEYLIFVASNGDFANATTYDVIVSKRA